MYPNKIARRDFGKKVGIGFGAALLAGCDNLHDPESNSVKPQFEDNAMQDRGRQIGTQMFSRYPMPVDPAAFDRHYLPHHVQLAKTNQDVLSIILSDGKPIVKQEGRAKDPNTELHKIGFTIYPTLPAARVSWDTPEGIVTGQDIDNYATGGLSLVFYDTNEMVEQNRVTMGPPLPGINKGRRCGTYVVTLMNCQTIQMPSISTSMEPICKR
jgi:hypothetical protein